MITHANERQPGGWWFHPYEMAVVGYQNSGKTTLCAGLLPRLGSRIGYIKRDAHRFSMDKPGKDTYILSQAGAHFVFISDPQSQAHLRHEPVSALTQSIEFLDADAVIVEGHKNSPLPKLVMLDHELAITRDPALLDPSLPAPLAAIGPWAEAPGLPWQVPYFQRDDLGGIAAFIKFSWQKQIDTMPLHGLVLSGGRSTRMGVDKAAMVWEGETALDRAHRLLSGVCDEVFVSCRLDQADDPVRSAHARLVDRFVGFGPQSGILSALHDHPKAAWLVLACDLPTISSSVLDQLVAGRNPQRYATAFTGTDGMPEPLCAIYEPKSRVRLLQLLAAGANCPRKLLLNSQIELLHPASAAWLANVNTPEQAKELGYVFA